MREGAFTTCPTQKLPTTKAVALGGGRVVTPAAPAPAPKPKKTTPAAEPGHRPPVRDLQGRHRRRVRALSLRQGHQVRLVPGPRPRRRRLRVTSTPDRAVRLPVAVQEGLEGTLRLLGGLDR